MGLSPPREFRRTGWPPTGTVGHAASRALDYLLLLLPLGIAQFVVTVTTWSVGLALLTLPAHRPELAIVDVRMPPTFRDEGLRAALRARETVPDLPVLVLSQYVEETYAVQLLSGSAGGVGYLLKERVADVAEFRAAVRRVASGGTAIDAEVVAQLMARGRQDPPGSLTARESEVLGLMAQGLSNTAIADRLVVSHGAVEKHVGNIFTKLGLEPGDTDHRRVRAVLTYLGR